MNREEIKQYIPHREPMLLIDEAFAEGGCGTGSYKVTGDEFFLKGHFPGNPVVPGVILCEIMAQSCSVVLLNDINGKTPYFTGLDKVRIRKSVVSGDTFTVKSKLIKTKGPFYFFEAEGFVGNIKVISGELSFALN